MARQPSAPESGPAPGGEGPIPLDLRRVAAVIEYDGTDFCGFQWQPTGRTVAGELMAAAARLGSIEPRLICAGRTDAGVHALGQVVAFDLPKRLEERRLLPALNANLPEDVRVRSAITCTPDFDPRRDAIRRTYRYCFCAGVPVPPTMRHSVAYHPRPMDPEVVARAAAAFLGRWEFSAWRSAQCEARITRLRITRADCLPPAAMGTHAQPTPQPWFELTFSARSFLHHMVRFLVGGVWAVATGRVSIGELEAALEAGTRPAYVAPADARGLCLMRVDYAIGRDPWGRA